jgi:hypothetical protein
MYINFALVWNFLSFSSHHGAGPHRTWSQPFPMWKNTLNWLYRRKMCLGGQGLTRNRKLSTVYWIAELEVWQMIWWVACATFICVIGYWIQIACPAVCVSSLFIHSIIQRNRKAWRHYQFHYLDLKTKISVHLSVPLRHLINQWRIRAPPPPPSFFTRNLPSHVSKA